MRNNGRKSGNRGKVEGFAAKENALVMKQYKQFSESKKRKVYFEELTMSAIKCGLMIIMLSILMTGMKVANARIEDGKFRHGLELSKYSSSLRHNLYRHYNHNYNRKHKYHNYFYDRSLYKQNYHVKKPRRYPALDKIDDRLNFLADYHYDKKLKITTSNPFDDWEEFTTPNATFFTSLYMKNYMTYKGEDDKTTTNHIDHKHKHREKSRGSEENSGTRDSEQDFSADSKGYMQDYTTAKPSEGVRQDTTLFDGPRVNHTGGNASATESPLENSNSFHGSWTLPHRSRTNPEDKKKKPTAKAYGPRDAAFEHLEQVHREGGCHTPKAKVVRVHEVHPDPSKSYSPPCTILHQCGADTGCCQNLKDVCKPKNSTKVELYFFTTVMGQPHKVEKLHFENHTECECRSRTEDLMPRDSAQVNTFDSGNKITARMGSEAKSNNCTCPSHFSPRYFHGGMCVCDCFDKQSDCLVLKKGKVNFSYSDRLCIQQAICRFPSCEFGSYILSYGRCPKSNEKGFYGRPRSYLSRDKIT